MSDTIDVKLKAGNIKTIMFALSGVGNYYDLYPNTYKEQAEELKTMLSKLNNKLQLLETGNVKKE